MTRGRNDGFTLMELLVAVALFGLIAAGLAQTLVAAQQSRAGSARWLHATALAEERLERLRAGDRSHDGGPLGEFTRTWRAAPAPALPGLEQLEVEVTWHDHGLQRFTLTALRRAGQ
jgi:prepilin-type N-terminal cleavage/methylation domain-containing protein